MNRHDDITVKICGLRDDAALQAALDAGADMVGFVFFPPSPRNLSIETAARLAAAARGRAILVALTVDADDALLAGIAQAVRPDWFQLHGAETPARCDDIRRRWTIPVIKALPVAGRDDLARAGDYAPHVDRILFDAKPPPGAVLPGGNGAPFDWSLLSDRGWDVPVMLSGGLDAGNVAEAIATSGLRAVDVSSGVERAPGEKDPYLVREFIARAKSAGDRKKESAA